MYINLLIDRYIPHKVFGGPKWTSGYKTVFWVMVVKEQNTFPIVPLTTRHQRNDAKRARYAYRALFASFG